jgi:hypothetical protein
MKTEILCDFNNLFWRCACVMPKEMEFGAEFGCIRSLLALKRRYPSARIRLAGDMDSRWRKDIFPEYKGKREDDDPFKTALYKRRDEFRYEICKIIPYYCANDHEADDVIAYLADRLAAVPDTHVFIYSPDQDFLQLVTYNIQVLKPVTGGFEPIVVTRTDVCEQWGIEDPQDLRWLRAFTGCSSDEVPGSRLPKKDLAKICSDMHTIDLTEPMEVQLDVLSRKGRDNFTPGRYGEFLRFIKSGKAERNYRVMTLRPAHLPHILQVDYTSDPEGFMSYCRDKKMMTILGQVNMYYGELDPPTDLERTMSLA